MLQIWITVLLLCTATYADVSHLHYHEPQYNLEPAASITHRPIYTLPPTRYDQVVAASSHAEKYSYDPPASQFNPYDVAASERRNTYAQPQRNYYQSSASAPKPTFTTFPTQPSPTVYVNDNRYNYNGQQGAASAYSPTYTGRPTYAGYQHIASPTQPKPYFQPTQKFNNFKPTYAGYQPVSASSENRRPTYAGYEPAPAASQFGYTTSVYTPSYNSRTTSYQSPTTSYQSPTVPTYNQIASPSEQRSSFTEPYPTREQMKTGKYFHSKSGMYNNGRPRQQQATRQYQQTAASQYQPQATIQQGIYYAATSYASPTQATRYETAATRVEAGTVKADGYHYDKPAIPFDPAPVRTPDAPSRLYEDAPPPPPVRRPTNPPPQYRRPTPAPVRFNPPPTPAPVRFNPPPTPAPVRINPAPLFTPAAPTLPPLLTNNYPTPEPVPEIEEVGPILNTTPASELVRITPRTTPRPRPTTPYVVTTPPPKVSDVVLLAFSASTIRPDISVDVYSPPPDVSATVRPSIRAQNRVSDRVLDNKPDLLSPAPFLATKPVTPIRNERSELQTSASEDQFQYLPPESPTFGGLREDGYHYEQPRVPFY